MMYYIVYIMKGADIGDELLTSAIQYIINVVMTLPAILYLDKIGRRPALILGSFLLMIWLFISGTHRNLLCISHLLTNYRCTPSRAWPCERLYQSQARPDYLGRPG